MKRQLAVIFLFLNFYGVVGFSLPKYGPNAVPLSRNTNREYFRKNDAPDFFALIGYYVSQPNDTSCSASNFSMILNALRRNHPLNSKDELITYESLLEKYTDDRYKKVMSGNLAQKLIQGFKREDVCNSRLVEVLKKALVKLQLMKPTTVIEDVKIDSKNKEKSRKLFHEALVKNEKSADDFLIISAYIQGKLTGDPEGMYSHVATVGAYDESKHLVLLLDPDRNWYEPYWSPEDKVFDAMDDPKADLEPGWIYLKSI